VDRNLVLQSGVFVNSDLKKCTNCQTQKAKQFLYGSAVSLTKILTDYIKSGERQPLLPSPDGMDLKTLDPDDVIPFLRRNLHWRVVDVSLIPISLLPFPLLSLPPT
jgi:Tyosinase C-terminal domain